MKTQEEISNLFDNLETIEPSVQWRDELTDKLHNAPAPTGNSKGYNLIIGLVVIVLIGNVLAFFLDTPAKTQASADKYKTIASELLISTTSSQF